jgi:hypothetical protein
MFTRPSCSSHTMPSTPRDTATVSKMGYTIVIDLPMLRVRRQNPSIGSELSRTHRVRDEMTRGGQYLTHLEPHHPQALYLSPDWEVSFTPLRVG